MSRPTFTMPGAFIWIPVVMAVILGVVSAKVELLRRDLRSTMAHKMQTEQELLLERQRPGLTPWEPVEVTYYGPGFHGRRAADGSTFDENLPTCASPSLDLGTVVVLRGTRGQLVPAIVSDRLPEKDRLDRLDVSTLVAKRLGMVQAGRVTVDAAALRVGGIQ